MRRLTFALSLACLGLAACEPKEGPWKSDVAFRVGTKLGGCAIGDVDPRREGNELVVVAGDGCVYVASWTGKAWKHEAAAKFPGEKIQVAVGDADPAHPGMEIVAVGVDEGGEGRPGAKGVAVLVWRTDAGWQQQTLFVDTALLHGVGFGLGGVVVAGYSNKAHLLRRAKDGAWSSTRVADLPGPGRSVASGAGGVGIACRDGSVVLVTRGDGGYATKLVDQRAGVGRARIGSDGKRFVVSDDDGALSIVADGSRSEVYRSTDKLRGAVLADLDPRTQGHEAATAGYDGTITVLRRTDEAWSPATVARDTDKFHHLAVGTLPPYEGTVLVGCGYAGNVIVVSRR